MTILKVLLAIFFTYQFASGNGFRYYVDETCKRFPDNRVTVAIAGAQKMALTANNRLISQKDIYTATIFDRIFKRPKMSPDINNQPQYQSVAALFLEVALMTETSNRQDSNYRFYCDNDPQSINGGTRWTLREDPPLNARPADYVPQRDRTSRYHNRPPTQEWEDKLNGMMMGSTAGCEAEGHHLAVTYNRRRHVTESEAAVAGPDLGRSTSTMTLCNRLLAGRLHSFLDFALASDLNRFHAVHGRTVISAFQSMTAFVILAQALRFTPWRRRPVGPHLERVNTDSWTYTLQLSRSQCFRNPENWAYFALLTQLADFGYHLGTTRLEMTQCHFYWAGIGGLPY